MRRVWISPKKALLEHFADLEDSRTRQPMYDLQELLLTAVCAVVCGADDWETVSLWGQANLPWLRQFLPFKNGVASHDTFGRVFGLLDAEPFETRFIAWMSGMCGALEGVQIAVDGKTARRSKALHRVSVYATGLGITLGQVKTAQKSNEITAIPELLDALLLKGCTVTIDAMRCQKAIAAKVISQEADYVLSVKNNQPTLAAAVESVFDEAKEKAWEGIPYTQAEWVDGEHGRMETRKCLVIHDGDQAINLKGWPSVRSLVMIESTREIKDKVSFERRYFISSLNVEASRMGDIVRGHWAVENGLHGSLDIAFGEDQARMRERNSAENFSILRRIALNLIRQDKTTQAGIKNRRLLAGWDQQYRQKILGIQGTA